MMKMRERRGRLVGGFNTVASHGHTDGQRPVHTEFRMISRCLILLLLLGTLPRLQAKESIAPPRIAVNNAAELKKSIGKTATVYGKVSTASISRSGHHFLNFYSSELVVVCFKEHAGKFEKGGPAKQFKGQEIEVTGKVELYRNRPQIKLTSPGQIKLARSDLPAKREPGRSTASPKDDQNSGSGRSELSDDDAKKDSAAKFELKQVGKATWLSPAGLRYAGYDPEGRTRVEHVLRHAADEPRRAGSHGVFDGGNDGTLATIDAAWKQIKRAKIKPRKEGRTSSYIVPMGKRVGYLGGQNGARRKNPPLTKVFIVVRTGTSEVITAFPR